MDLQQTKSVFYKVMIGCLVAAASLAVVTVLIGEFNSVSIKALWTILLVALHCLVSFSFVMNNDRQETFDSLRFFTNFTFIIIIFSFITSILGTWSILPGELVARLYGAYFVFLFASLHGEVLAKIIGKQASIDNLVYANYIFMAIVVLMLMPVIFTGDNSSLGSAYYRLLAACGIIDATLTLIAVIMHKLYLQKHPAIQDNVFSIQIPGQPGQPTQVNVQQPKKGMNIFVVLLIAYVVLQFIGGIFVAVLGAVSR